MTVADWLLLGIALGIILLCGRWLAREMWGPSAGGYSWGGRSYYSAGTTKDNFDWRGRLAEIKRQREDSRSHIADDH